MTDLNRMYSPYNETCGVYLHNNTPHFYETAKIESHSDLTLHHSIFEMKKDDKCCIR